PIVCGTAYSRSTAVPCHTYAALPVGTNSAAPPVSRSRSRSMRGAIGARRRWRSTAARRCLAAALVRTQAAPLRTEAIGGRVGAPRGLLIAGDLTEMGAPHEWTRFEAIFSLTGKEGWVHYPV